MALIEELDDRTLVELHRAGDDDAFRRIVERHHRSLYANALRRLGDPVLAEDALQETFLRAFRNLDRFDGDYHLDAWLHRIVTNACHDIGRRQGRDTRLFDRACTTIDVESPAADDGLEAMPPQELDRALDQLPETYREVLLLRFVDEMSYSDVALKAGISEENARARVSRGRTMLKRMLSSTSAVVVWAIQPLRRAQLEVTDPEAAAQAAQQVHTLTGLTNVVSTTTSSGGFSQLTTLVAQAGPAIATAAPTATSAGPALKAAMAAGLAAAVAIPTGVAVDRAFQKPVPQAAAPADDVEVNAASAGPGGVVVAPSTTVAAGVESLGASDATTGSISASGGTIAGPTTSTTPTTQPASSTTTVPETDGSVAPATPTTQVPAGGEAPTEDPAPTPPPPAPSPSGQVDADGLSWTETGPHLELSGPIRLQIGDDVLSGDLTSKVDVAPASAKDPDARRQVEGWLRLELEDGSVLHFEFVGTAIVSREGEVRSHQLGVRYILEGADEHELAAAGEALTWAITLDGDTASLDLVLPGRSS